MRFFGLMLLGWAGLVVAIAALTTWWVLGALLPLVLMTCMAMMAPMMRFAAEAKGGPWGWCTGWFAPTERDVGPRASHG